MSERGRKGVRERGRDEWKEEEREGGRNGGSVIGKREGNRGRKEGECMSSENVSVTEGGKEGGGLRNHHEN